MSDRIVINKGRKIGTIHIKSSEISSFQGGESKLVYAIDVDNNVRQLTTNLEFTLEEKYKDYICSEIVDGVIIMLLPYALRGGYDIITDIPMTEQLYYTVTSQLIPQLMTCNDLHHTKIIADTVSPDWNPTAVATAMSLGVDSLSTFFEYSQADVLSDYRITHLAFFENGAHHGGNLGHSKREKAVYEDQLRKVQDFCDKVGYDLIYISSNLDEFLDNCFWKDSYQCTHTYRNAGFALILQKLIKIYYYSPAYCVNDFSCLLNEDSAHYEALLLPNISTKYLRFYNSSLLKTRLDKILYISQFPETYDSLLVCYVNGKNCGECIKCKRTQVEMDILGVLDLYKKSFDLEKYKKNRRKCFAYCLSKRNKEELMHQIHIYIQENNVKVPTGAYFMADVRMILVGTILLLRRFKRIIQNSLANDTVNKELMINRKCRNESIRKS